MARDAFQQAEARRDSRGSCKIRSHSWAWAHSTSSDHHSIRLEDSPANLERLANRGASKSSPEILSFVQEWRPQGEVTRSISKTLKTLHLLDFTA
jgi:hypothetical protein